MSLKRKASTTLTEAPPLRRTWFWQHTLQRMFGSPSPPPNSTNSRSGEPSVENIHDKTSSTENHLRQEDVPAAHIEPTDTPLHTNWDHAESTHLSINNDDGNETESSDMHDDTESTNGTDELSYYTPSSPDIACHAEDVSAHIVFPQTPEAILSPSVTQHEDGQTGSNSYTDIIFNAFQDSYGCEYARSRFVGLCAYLSAVLCLGYRIRTVDMDGFISMYSKYREELGQLVRTQIENNQTNLISYHHWYIQQIDKSSCHAPILDEQNLRRIWSENLFVFLKVEYSMEMVARDARNQQAVRPCHR
ncbi:hypothetical protein ES702_02639 [subsurface metagenome]